VIAVGILHERLLNDDALVVAVPAEEFGHGVDRLRVGGDAHFEPVPGLRGITLSHDL
jgi:hypothetical protein